MNDKSMLTPGEVAEYTIETGIKKANTSTQKTLISGMLAGAYISLGVVGSMAAAYNLLANPATYGLGKMVAGLMFPTGLMFVLVAGADLFTGNILMILAVLKKKATWGQALKNWALVWIGNLVGAILVIWLTSLSGIFNWSDGLFGGVVVKTAIGKSGLSLGGAIASGILCNWIVCLTVWMSYASKDIAGKILTIFFGIFLFVCTGFEHCVANMGYLFAGLFNKTNILYLEAAHKTAVEASVINIPNIFINNLIPVTIGNAIGGAVLVAGVYYFLYIK